MRNTIAALALSCLVASPLASNAQPVVKKLHGQSQAYRHAVECAGLSEWLYGEAEGVPPETRNRLLQVMHGWRDAGVKLGEASAQDTDWDGANYAYDLTDAYIDLSAAEQNSFIKSVVAKVAECTRGLPN